MRFVLITILLALLSGCHEKITSLEDLHTSDLTLPNGQIIKIETMVDTRDQMRGLAFRPSIAPDEGMLFVHRTPGSYSFWMYQHFMPLDMIFLGDDQRIVEIVENAQPCKTAASQCPHYGGTKTAKYGLEMGGGAVQKYHLKIGDRLRW